MVLAEVSLGIERGPTRAVSKNRKIRERVDSQSAGWAPGMQNIFKIQSSLKTHSNTPMVLMDSNSVFSCLASLLLPLIFGLRASHGKVFFTSYELSINSIVYHLPFFVSVYGTFSFSFEVFLEASRQNRRDLKVLVTPGTPLHFRARVIASDSDLILHLSRCWARNSDGEGPPAFIETG